ncbi:hypothetical protein KY359_02435 [Candidatus Woesearchaeota archaeon]|nr:hypothetical protein [Candidatus Woesearchaeota archaeon]
MDDDKALLVLRPQVLAKISDLRAENDYSPLVIPPKNEMVWTPDVVDITPAQDYSRYDPENFARKPTLPMRDSDGLARFIALNKKSNDIISLQRKIAREIGYDETGGFARWANSMVNETKRKLGLKVRTLEDLFEEEQKLVNDMHGLLSRLYELCTQNFNSLVSFRQSGTHQVAEISRNRPGTVRYMHDAQQDFEDSLGRLSSVERGSPEFYYAREAAALMRDHAADAAHHVRLNHEREGMLNMFLERIDCASQILRTGTYTVQRIGARYEIAAEFLKAWPAFSTIRNLFNYFATFKGVNDALGIAFDQAKQIEGELNSPHVLARVYHEMPSLGTDGGMYGVTDRLNQQLYLCSSDRDKGPGRR